MSATHPGAALDDVQPGIDQALDDEVLTLLAGWRERYAGRPLDERRRLLLLALEREQIVTIAYREEVLAERIEALEVPDDLRALIRRALAWAWRDEALHVDWVRGQLRHEHRPVPIAVLLSHQFAGLVAGWVTTTRRHPRLGRQVADTVARSMIEAGRLARQVSPALARELRVPQFRRYCLLNAALERTAERCWLRLAELADGDERAAMARIAEDEANHRSAFLAIASVLDDDDRLRADASIDDLRSRLGEISPWFLPGEHRDVRRSGIGRNLPVAVAGGPDHAKVAALHDVFERGGLRRMVLPGTTVAIRTAFMLGYHPDDRSNIVDPELLAELAKQVRAAGAADVVVLDVANVYDRYVRNRSVAEVAARLGYESDAHRIVDAASDQVPCSYPRGLGRSTISGEWLRADLRIVLAKACTDPVEYGHLCLCTLEGISGRVDQTLYLGRFTDFRSATMMAIDLAPPDFAVVDAWGPVADGAVGVMGSHRPCHPRRVYAGADAVAVDLAVLADMGAPDGHRIPMVAAATQWLGVELRPPVVDGPTGRWGGSYRGPDSNPWDRLVCRLAYPVYTYGGALGARFLPAFDRHLFPPKPARWDLRLSRRITPWVFGIRPPRTPRATG